MPKFQSPVHFTVSQIRVAATCPRIFYFDSQKTREQNLSNAHVTRIWDTVRDGKLVTAAGGLFHTSVEKFNKLAAVEVSVTKAIQEESEPEKIHRALLTFFTMTCLNRKILAEKPPETILAFTDCAKQYMQELTDLIVYARSNRIDPHQIVRQLFGDKRKAVDVTFYVGPDKEPVHVTGRLDYVFYDWRCENYRIFDYKLTPSDHPANDIFQVATYALMHHHQHQTSPDVAVFYLHPKRQLASLTWQQVYEKRHQVYDLLASMLEWKRFLNGEGFQPPGAPEYCDRCSWSSSCEASLGTKSDGDRFVGWSSGADNERDSEPVVEQNTSPLSEQEAENDDDFGAETRSDGSAGPDNGRENADDQLNLDALQLGTTVSDAMPIAISTPNLSTHTAIVGAAGSGKTWLAKVFIEEAIMRNVPVLAVDPQGDLVQFLCSQRRDDIPEIERERFDTFHNLVEPRVFTPGTSHATRLSINPIRLPRPEDLSGLAPGRREEEFDAIVNAVATQLAGLALKGKRSVEQQQTFLASVLRGLIRSRPDRELNLNDISSGVLAPEGLGIDDPEFLIKKTDRENLGRQINAMAHGPLSRMFSGGVALNIDRMRRADINGKIPLNVVYLNALSEPEKHAFLASLATEIYRWMSCSGGSADSPQLLFYLDEARDYLPAGTAMPPAKQPVSRLFTQGRKYGVGCAVSTQSPRSVDYNVFGNCSTKIIGRLETPQDAERVAEWFAQTGVKPPWIAERSGADKGTFVIRWPKQPESTEGKVFRSRHLYSAHEGAWSPDQVEDAVDRLRGSAD